MRRNQGNKIKRIMYKEAPLLPVKYGETRAAALALFFSSSV